MATAPLTTPLVSQVQTELQLQSSMTMLKLSSRLSLRPADHDNILQISMLNALSTGQLLLLFTG